MKLIEELFMNILGVKDINFQKIKKMQRFNLFLSPKDLKDLKRMAGVCKFCKKPTDNINICILCGEKCCIKCQLSWVNHYSVNHNGATAVVNVKTGHVYYEVLKLRWDSTGLYKNYLGQDYRGERWVKDEEFMLDETLFERTVENLVLERVETIVEKKVEERARDNGCQVQ